jgi:O-antigen/teichoic acid export membrane protein
MSEKQAKDSDLGIEVSKGFVGRVAGAIFGFVGTIVFARLLGPTEFGGFYLLLSLVSISQRPLKGLGGAVQKRFAERGSLRRQLFGLQLISNFVFFALLGLVLVLFRDRLVAYTGLEGSLLFFALLFVVLSTFSTFQNLLTAIGRVGIQTWIDSVRSITTLAGQLLFVSAGYGAAGMAFGLVGGTIVTIPATHYYLRTLPAVPSLETVRSVWSFARYNIPSSFVGHAYDRFDILLLGFLATQAIAGKYEVAYKLTLPAMFIAGIIGSGLGAKVSDFDSRDEEPTRDIVNSLSFGSIFAIPLFFGALAISKPVVVTLYGPEYASASVLLIGLALYRVIQTQAGILSNIVSGIDLPERDFHAAVVALLVNIPLGILLFESMGAIGVVVATIVAEAIRYMLLFHTVSSRISANLLSGTLISQVLSGSLMFLFVEQAHVFIRVRSWIDLVVLVGFGVVVYSLALFAMSGRLRQTVTSIFYRLFDGMLKG